MRRAGVLNLNCSRSIRKRMARQTKFRGTVRSNPFCTGRLPGQPNDKCIAMCAKGSSSQYALYDGKVVLRLTDQKMTAKYAAQRVKVTGALNDKTQTVKVSSIEPEGGSK